MEAPQASGPVFTEDDCINLYYLNELYGKVAVSVSSRMRQIHNIDGPITSGIWGGTYLIADPFGKSLRRIWRFYCIVNLPQDSPLDKHENMEKLVSVSSRMRQIHNIDVPITSGSWGGTYLIADPFGKSLRRIWRFYCIVNLPQNSPLDKHENLESW